MKLCLVTTSYPRYEGDFAGAFLSHLCKELARLAVEVRVIVPNDTRSKQHEKNGNIAIKRFNYFLRRFQRIAYGYGGILINLKNNPWLMFLLPFFAGGFFVHVFRAARKSDLIHVNWIPTGYMCAVVKLILKKPLILTIRGKDMNLYQSQQKLFRLLSRMLFPHIDLFTTVSKEFAHFLTNEGLIRPEKIFVVPNGVSDIEIEAQRLRQHKIAHGVPQEGFKAIYVGSLTKLKGIRWLIHAWKFVAKEAPTAKLLIIGDGDDRKHLGTMARKLGVGENIIFYGHQPTYAIPYWLACADIFVLPSLFEGRPNAVLEAFQSQLPVVATNIAGIREIVDDSVNGFLVPGKDSRALSVKILQLFSSERLRKKMGRAGKESIRARGLTWENCAERYLGLYKNVLNM
jgi:glycosyltransferase involved in cell wall biosynthesis